MNFTSQMFRSADEFLELMSALRWFASDPAHIVLIHITFVVMPVYIFMVRNRASESYLMAKLVFHLFVYYGCFPTYIFGFYHK